MDLFPTIKLRFFDFVLQLLNVMIDTLISQIQIFRDVNPDSLSRVIIFFLTRNFVDTRFKKSKIHNGIIRFMMIEIS